MYGLATSNWRYNNNELLSIWEYVFTNINMYSRYISFFEFCCSFNWASVGSHCLRFSSRCLISWRYSCRSRFGTVVSHLSWLASSLVVVFPVWMAVFVFLFSPPFLPVPLVLPILLLLSLRVRSFHYLLLLCGVLVACPLHHRFRFRWLSPSSLLLSFVVYWLFVFSAIFWSFSVLSRVVFFSCFLLFCLARFLLAVFPLNFFHCLCSFNFAVYVAARWQISLHWLFAFFWKLIPGYQ